MNDSSILVAAIGNIFLGDDGFGPEVARRLLQRTLPDEVSVVDFGIRGFDLAYALGEPHSAVVMIDATPRGGAPGTLYVIEPDLDAEMSMADIETHAMDPLRVLRLAYALGASPSRVLVIGVEPTLLSDDEVDDGLMGLSEAVQCVLDEALELVESVLAELTRKEPVQV